jgi:hypothetical protein
MADRIVCPTRITFSPLPWRRGEDKGEEFEPGTVFAATLTLPLSLRKGEATKKKLIYEQSLNIEL